GIGAISLTGAASTGVGASSGNGISVTGDPSTVSTNSGNINLSATGNGTAANNLGLNVSGGGSIITASGLIQTPMPATAGSGTTGCIGINVTGTNTQIKTTGANGSINLTGLGAGNSTGNRGIFISSPGV